ncbi:hypothetical protein D3C76_1635300 [compost metagenome]
MRRKMTLASAGEHRIGEQAEVQQVQAKMSSDGCCQSSKTVGQAIADPGQAGQQDPLPASTGMRQAKDQRSQEQRKVFTMTQIFQPATQATLDITAKQRLLDQCHQQQIVQ